MPNLFAYFALIIWPIVAIQFYKRLPVIPATFWTIVGGYLILPVRTEIDFPLIPPLDKSTVSALSALIGCIYVAKKKITLLPKSGPERLLVLLFFIAPFFTVLNNQEPIYRPDTYIAGLTLHDALSMIINQYLFILPFIIGMQIFKTYEDQLVLFKLLVITGLWYSLPIIFEVRMSPQLHTWIYGFFPHTFLQQMRDGGFRAVVFLGHGLLVSMFITITLACAVLLWKNKVKIHNFSPKIVIAYLSVILFISKSVGALLFGVFFVFSIAWLAISKIRYFALVFMFFALCYPLMSSLDIFPHQFLVESAEDFSPERAQSLLFRFKNEEDLLAHAEKKLFFGWGAWDRNRLENSVTDGFWIIVFGQFGLIGFCSFFGLLALSVWNGVKTSKFSRSKNTQRLLAVHALIVSIVMLDQLPNSSLHPWLWLVCGALLGRARYEELKEANK